ncbi:hypothetical protein Q766_16960 [Flavobacterium subsaxonicum WB 4.1-42 = DSM 21790]|uniref:DUF4348 domain-containing protein n=2 Tax=Flavobacterium TaxID=237 RepID=A0A0A2MTK0_9FLAO|nr:hypothetical protein Q766_16960 [Flavobacterium subsaxonicum WB 4.1-42 = DSM 21790]
MLLGCNRNKGTKEEVKMPIDEIVCEVNFDAFFKAFVKDSLYQREHIKFPLLLHYYENSADTLITEYVGRDNYQHFLKLPQTDFQSYAKSKINYKHEIDRNKDTVTCIYKAIESEQTLNYKFSYYNNCWYLVDIHDYSVQTTPFKHNMISKIADY